MTRTSPPKLAIYLLNRFGSPYRLDSLAGDLIEQFRSGRSKRWFWRQILSAILAARMRTIESTHWPSIAKTALRIVNAIMLAAALALGVGTLTRADSPQDTCPIQARC
jgi:hypothetical protein